MDRIEKDIGEGEEVPMLHTMRMESEVTSADIYLKHPGDEEDDQVSLISTRSPDTAKNLPNKIGLSLFFAKLIFYTLDFSFGGRALWLYCATSAHSV